MRNKSIIIIILVVILLAIAGWWFFLRTNTNTKTYTIKEWNNYAQTVEISISDNTILKTEKSSEPDNNTGALTGGEYTIFTITGLKKGKTTAIVTVYNSDYSVEKQTVYDFEVLEDLSVHNLSESSVTNLSN